ncbi:pyridoxamine 5'-phosphate oxidase family protein [Paenibacillus sp. MMS20-IR301]|uniref:pyridoxamine 5'-phosphate oxidase family protein n=1 Tax=Paenibacillus sp. MMS20-IR301 TaxID=2895946 RepID=UPI0028E26B18|nr:pyridoxamine 5'-phosphate oxidase family protein [Paenibacillus sp. MMS20-IR301]WNS43805.1 pyridoxamine 5'-phosphate oxidase family protein [Paenibacillus sp. MMS20-IR301]
MSEAVAQLNETLLAMLQSETFVLLNTVDAESGGPTSTAISWIYAVSPSTLRLAVDHRSRLVNNMKVNPMITVTVFGEGTVHAINGRASVKQDPLSDVPFKMCCFDVEIEAVRNALFYGAHLESAPKYAKVYDARAAEKLDGQVFAAMQKA